VMMNHWSDGPFVLALFALVIIIQCLGTVDDE
jgi:hypothetical protein